MGHTPPEQPPVGAAAPQAVRQRRHVTFLFADLVGSSALSEQLDPEVFHDLIDQWLQAMTEEVERFGGTLNQFSGDGILALFGAPLAQEDAPVQACRAALFLQRRLASLDTPVRLSMRIGVDSGEIVAGLVGTDRRNEYAALGQRTNRAKRVQEQADPGSILISEDTYGLVREYFRLVSAGEFLAKGLSHPVVGYRLLDEQERGPMPRLAATMARWHSPLVGRSTEVATLDQAVSRAANRRAQLVAIEGDAGVGKSRLLHELMHDARRRGFVVHEGRSAALRTHVPYAPYADIIRSICDILVDDAPRVVDAKLRASFPDDVAYLQDVIAPPAAQANQTVLDSNARMMATLSAIERTIRRAAACQPLLLVLDDAQWSDRLSRELTVNLMRACSTEAILICTAARSGMLALDTPSAETMRLQPLHLDDISELARTLDGLSPADVTRLAGWLERQTGGVPLFIEELLVALQSSGALSCDGARWTLAADFQHEHLPGSVHDLIASRIDRMEPRALATLQLAAVIGDGFLLPEIEALAAPSDAVAAAVADLEQHGFLTPDARSAGWRFRSALTQRVVYRTLPRQRRAALHLRLAEAIALQRVPQVDDTVLANHFHLGGATLEAIALLRRAAARAEWAFANADADALLTQVLTIGGGDLSDADRADVLIHRGHVRTAFLGDAAGLADIDDAIAHATGVRDSVLHSRALLTKGVALYRQFRFVESLEWLERAAVEATAPEVQIEALLQRAFVLSEMRISGTATTTENVARDCCEQALALSRTHHNRALEIQSLHSLGTAYLQELDYDQAQAMFETCVEQAQSVEDRATEALALQSLARVQQFRGAFDTAAATIVHLQGLLRGLGDRRRLAFSAFNLAAAQLGCGHPDEARQAAEDALTQATQLGLDYLRKLALRFLIGLYDGTLLRAQRIAAAETLRTLLTADGERSELSDLLILLADTYAAGGGREAAIAMLANAAKLDIELKNFTRAQSSLLRLQNLRKELEPHSTE